MVEELSYQQVRKVCTYTLECESTKELSPLEGIIGQDRAVKALLFGLNIEESGFNVYVSGYPGTGRETASISFLEEIAKKKPTPSDWCYVYGFDDPYRPEALELPAGKGREFKEDMKVFIDNAKKALGRAFESEEYDQRRSTLVESVSNESRALTQKIAAEAQKQGFAFQRTQTGVLLVPIVEGKPLEEEEFAKMPDAMKQRLQEKRHQLEDEFRNTMRQLRDLERKTDAQIQELDKEVALYAIEPLVNGLLEKYGKIEDVKHYIEEVREDIAKNLPLFLGQPEEKTPQLPYPLPQLTTLSMNRYEVNLIVDNSKTEGAPVIMEPNPSYVNLVGRMEKEAQFGALITDFTLIRGGALHRANGGYLVMHAEDVLADPLAWDIMKRSLMNEQITIEDIVERAGMFTSKSLRPEPIPLKIKVVLIGEPMLYYLLYQADRNFNELFKVKADFDVTMDLNEENVKDYAAFVCSLCRKEGLRHLEGSAIAEIIEYSSRLAEDQMKLSTRFAQVADIIREASFYAEQEGKEFVTEMHVKKALEEKVYRSNLIQGQLEEMIARGQLLIDTEGEKVGQVNGLAVVGLGDFEFGNPSRITASVALGREEKLLDIERESEMGGKIHTKGVLILGGYLSERYAQNAPLSLSARLVFEQSYGGVEGDSASSTELYALLSALSGLPVKQYIAVTGSVNQKGEVQPIGGVNSKIEGFFEVCKKKGLTGKQGIMIPQSNVQNLMLNDEVVEAVKEGKFHIYAVKTVDEGIEALTGMKAGARKLDGTYEEGTVNDLIQKRLLKMAEKLKEYSA
jgi:lon-related putative ATP-dependent protease